jgi:hypothetical protein
MQRREAVLNRLLVKLVEKGNTVRNFGLSELTVAFALVAQYLIANAILASVNALKLYFVVDSAPRITHSK